MNEKYFISEIYPGEGPLIATAIHDGHILRPEVAALINLGDKQRLQEEDPFTSVWTSIANVSIIGLRSRFEVDLNRPREKAVYIKPEDAWGLNVWKHEPTKKFIANSLFIYDDFYRTVFDIFTKMLKKYQHLVVFDLHSYNFRREGPHGPPASPELNPEVNIGTGTMDRNFWAPVVDQFIDDLRAYNYFSRNLDVRENIKFKGGNFSRWIHDTFPESVCSIAVEFKKFFMDEWTGEPDQNQIKEIGQALKSTVPGILKTLEGLK